MLCRCGIILGGAKHDLGLLLILELAQGAEKFHAAHHRHVPVEQYHIRHRILDTDQRLTSIFRSAEHTSELQSLMRISYAVSSLKNKINNTQQNNTST